MDAFAGDCDVWAVFILAAVSLAWTSCNLRVACVLLLHGIVSRLARDFVIWKPIFCVADNLFCVGAGSNAGLGELTFSKSKSCAAMAGGGVKHICDLESRIDFSMGGPSDSGARSSIVEGSYAQPVSCRATRNCFGARIIPVSAQRYAPRNRTAGHGTTESSRSSVSFRHLRGRSSLKEN